MKKHSKKNFKDDIISSIEYNSAPLGKIDISSSSSDANYSENFSWVNLKGNLENERKFSLYPLDKWRELIPQNQNPKRLRESIYYQNCTNSILSKDVFPNENYTKETFECNCIESNEISPDFYIKDMEVNKFKKILEERNYIFKMNYKIPENIKKINIIGEIKSSKAGFKKKNQKKNYLSYSEKNSNSTVLILVMYIFDKSYQDFYLSKVSDTEPLVYGYVPKIYREECFVNQAYINHILKDKETPKSFDNIVRDNYKKLYDSPEDKTIYSKDNKIDKKASDNIYKKYQISFQFNILFIIIILILIIIIIFLLKQIYI